MKKQIIKLLDVKTIITITVLGWVSYYVFTNTAIDDFIKTTATSVITFYFGMQYGKTTSKLNVDDKEE